ncbi:hypothetical protein [Methyloversatilis sp.]|uniref:hypothetical protein n=1 Tax=Methyloversatilis sp. TaxID=2569862 RepID=UPI002736D322|nr:hypothetical protein [Methyloversatilis sp.]MDP2870479.1 hypothetical protein [Methyloversatilis sp.]MDP3457452.1 hypothetical protein [Methyloversatilis sp.]MDP3576525.1 hypothetical protein [Methyloversatilis sp.]
MTSVVRLIAALLLTAVTGAFVLATNRDIQMSCTPHGMLSLQFAGSAECARLVVQSWAGQCADTEAQRALHGCAAATGSPDAAQQRVESRPPEARLHTARQTLWADFAFMAAYSIFLWMLCARAAATLGGAPRRVGQAATFAAPLAGLADVSENIAHLVFLSAVADGPGEALFAWGHYSVMLKWGLISLIAAFLAAAGLRMLVRWAQPAGKRR